MSFSLGGALRSDPTAVIFDGQTYVFGIGLDDAVWYRTPQTAGPASAESLVSDLGVTTDGTSLYVTGVGIDDAIWARRMSGLDVASVGEPRWPASSVLR